MIQAKPSRKPNIVLLIMDTVRADHCSTWGYERDTTPCLSQLAQSSMVFMNAIAPSPWTVPSHLSLFTGLFPSEHGCFDRGDSLQAGQLSLTEILQRVGYRTAGFTNNPLASSLNGLDRGFELFVEVFRGQVAREKGPLRKNLHRAQRLLFLKDGGAQNTNVKVTQWIDEWAQKDSANPFFVFVNYMDAHQVYAPQRPFHHRFLGRQIPCVEAWRNRNIARNKARVYAGTLRPRSRDYTAMENTYDRAISYLDFRIGELVRFLQERKLLDNTLLIITSDHGETFGEHHLAQIGLIGHLFCLYDPLLRVPLLVRWPEAFKGGERRTDLVQIHDTFYTILAFLELEGRKPAHWWEGDLLVEHRREFAFAEYVTPPMQLEAFRRAVPEHTFEEFDVDLKAIRTLQHKLIRSQDGKEELYDLDRDPKETDDLSNQNIGSHTSLASKLEQWIAAMPDRAERTRVYSEPEDDIVRSRLADLGYL